MATTANRTHNQTNISQAERVASLVGGGALIAWGLKQKSVPGILTAALGGMLAHRGVTGHCNVYEALGIQTDRRTGRNVSIPYELGIRVDQVVTVDKPREE